MISLIKFQPEHLDQMDLKNCHEGERPIAALVQRQLSYTFIRQDKPIAIIGGYPLSDGVYQVWACVTSEVRKCPLAFTRATIAIIEQFMEAQGVRRMQMSVRCGFEMERRWAEAIGFELEGTMREYRPGADHWLFARGTWQHR